MKATLFNKKGMTLIELLMALAILAVIMVSTFAVLNAGVKTYSLNFNSTVSQQNLRSAMITITKKVRNAPTGAATITGTKVLTVSSKNFTVSAGQLMYNGAALASNITSINADYTDTTHTVIQVDLTSADGNTLSTQIRVN